MTRPGSHWTGYQVASEPWQVYAPVTFINLNIISMKFLTLKTQLKRASNIKFHAQRSLQAINNFLSFTLTLNRNYTNKHHVKNSHPHPLTLSP